MNEIPLPGCTPEPLMSYLKALGVFRLVAEQVDPSAKLAWADGRAVLHTALDRDALVRFFLEAYRPTPVMVPWSGADFFGINRTPVPAQHVKTPTAPKIIEAMLVTTTDRLKGYRAALHVVMDCMADLGIRAKADIEGTSKKKIKSRFLDHLRSELPEEAVFWMDAASQAEEEGAKFNPLLGSGGGSDGNTHFSDNFMQSLWECLPDFDPQRKRAEEMKPSVLNALFGEFDGTQVARTGALYDSGAVGGPNATQGLTRAFQVNPWSVILGLEGSLSFAGGLAKRHGSASAASSSFPFIVQMTAAGFATAVLKEYGQYEVWLPTWEKPWSYAEHQHLMREGRVQLGRRPARTGMDFSRAVRTLGVATGIGDFRRYGLIRGRVGGENYFTAASLGTYRVGFEGSVTLIDQLDPWLSKFSSAVKDNLVPARYRSAFNKLDATIDEVCRSRHAKGLHALLLQIGRVERLLSTGLAFAKDHGIRPLSGLTDEWLTQADDGSPEFRLAASLAGMRGDKAVGPIRAFLEEVEVAKYVNWSPGSTAAVWSRRPLAENLAAVFRRRQMEAFRAGLIGVPVATSRFARLDDVIAFLHGDTDDDKLGDLLWGLIAVEPPSERPAPEPSRDAVPFAFGVPRLLVEGEVMVAANGEHWNVTRSAEANAKPDPDVFHQLASGWPEAVAECVTRAARRLKSGGLIVTGYCNRRQSGRKIEATSPIPAARLLAAMLFPLSNRDLGRIANSVLYPPPEN